LRKLRSRLTYANVMATIALFIALGGTAYAAATIGSEQVMNESLLTQDLKDNAAVKSRDVADSNVSGGGLTSPDIRRNALTGGEINESTLSGVVKDTVIRVGDSSGQGAISAGASASCHSGEVATGGGGDPQGQNGGSPVTTSSIPAQDTGLPGGQYFDGATPFRWVVGVKNDAASGTVSVTPLVVCAKK
jgi:hypothetical protein